MNINKQIRFRPDAAMSDAESVHVYQEVSSDGHTWVTVGSFFITKPQFEDLASKLQEYFE